MHSLLIAALAALFLCACGDHDEIPPYPIALVMADDATAEQVEHIEASAAMWEAKTGCDLFRVTSGHAHGPSRAIVFNDVPGGYHNAHTNVITLHVDAVQFGHVTAEHELGHALGLGHEGGHLMASPGTAPGDLSAEQVEDVRFWYHHLMD
jgi:hypothetical protein